MPFCEILFLFLLQLQPIQCICYPTEPLLPRPDIPEDWQLTDLTKTLDDFVQNSADYGWNSSTNAFSVMATSPNHTFFRYHHTALMRNSSGVQEVNDDTVYMAASITKVFTVLAVMLNKKMSLDDPIGKHVEELDVPEWEHVTLRLLSNQQAALPRWGYLFDQAAGPDDLEPLGFPRLSPADIPDCGLGMAGRMCTRKEFLDSLLDFGFTGQVGHSVAYSNLAYSLLGYALENVTGQTYEDVLRTTITSPLGLENTSTTPFPLHQAILPSGAAPLYGVALEYFNPTAGLYSSPTDLTRFIRAIYTHKLLPQPELNSWLKPSGFTSQLDNLVGAPWEIFRPTTLTTPLRPVDHYTKSGDMPGLSSSYLVLVPEYGLGVTILGAGRDASTVVPLLLDLMQAVLVPRLEGLVREQVGERYAGVYRGIGEDEGAVMELVLDERGGLKVGKWMNRGVDMLSSFNVLMLGARPKVAKQAGVRLYPLDVGRRWRVGFEEAGEGEEEQAGNALRGSACMLWLKVDSVRYGKVSVDEVEFRLDEEGKVKGVFIPCLRVDLDKV